MEKIGHSIAVIGFAILTPQDAPPIPLKVLNLVGDTLFTRDDIVSDQEVFLKYGLMENGTVCGHGAYLGPDFPAEYLHILAIDAVATLAQLHYGRLPEGLAQKEQISPYKMQSVRTAGICHGV